MKKKYFSILLLFTCFSIISQQSSGTIYYGEKITSATIDTSKISNSNAKSVITYQMKAIEKALSGDDELYTLKFNDIESRFEQITFVENEANPHLKRALTNGVYFLNLIKKEKIRQLFAYDDFFIINSTYDKIKWTITKETKKIGQYLCYKATTEIENHKKIKTKVVAWFSPELPYSYGPKNYSGLPGLILALNERGHYFYAMRIALSNNRVSIKRPKKGKNISETEFNNIGNTFIKKIREGN